MWHVQAGTRRRCLRSLAAVPVGPVNRQRPDLVKSISASEWRRFRTALKAQSLDPVLSILVPQTIHARHQLGTIVLLLQPYVILVQRRIPRPPCCEGQLVPNRAARRSRPKLKKPMQASRCQYVSDMFDLDAGCVSQQIQAGYTIKDNKGCRRAPANPFIACCAASPRCGENIFLVAVHHVHDGVLPGQALANSIAPLGLIRPGHGTRYSPLFGAIQGCLFSVADNSGLSA